MNQPSEKTYYKGYPMARLRNIDFEVLEGSVDALISNTGWA